MEHWKNVYEESHPDTQNYIKRLSELWDADIPTLYAELGVDLMKSRDGIRELGQIIREYPEMSMQIFLQRLRNICNIRLAQPQRRQRAHDNIVKADVRQLKQNLLNREVRFRQSTEESLEPSVDPGRAASAESSDEEYVPKSFQRHMPPNSIITRQRELEDMNLRKTTSHRRATTSPNKRGAIEDGEGSSQSARRRSAIRKQDSETKVKVLNSSRTSSRAPKTANLMEEKLGQEWSQINGVKRKRRESTPSRQRATGFPQNKIIDSIKRRRLQIVVDSENVSSQDLSSLCSGSPDDLCSDDSEPNNSNAMFTMVTRRKARQENQDVTIEAKKDDRKKLLTDRGVSRLELHPETKEIDFDDSNSSKAFEMAPTNNLTKTKNGDPESTVASIASRSRDITRSVEDSHIAAQHSDFIDEMIEELAISADPGRLSNTANENNSKAKEDAPNIFDELNNQDNPDAPLEVAKPNPVLYFGHENLATLATAAQQVRPDTDREVEVALLKRPYTPTPVSESFNTNPVAIASFRKPGVSPEARYVADKNRIDFIMSETAAFTHETYVRGINGKTKRSLDNRLNGEEKDEMPVEVPNNIITSHFTQSPKAPRTPLTKEMNQHLLLSLPAEDEPALAELVGATSQLPDSLVVSGYLQEQSSSKPTSTEVVPNNVERLRPAHAVGEHFLQSVWESLAPEQMLISQTIHAFLQEIPKPSGFQIFDSMYALCSDRGRGISNSIGDKSGVMLFPVHHPIDMHWTLVAANRKTGTAQHYDSLKSSQHSQFARDTIFNAVLRPEYTQDGEPWKWNDVDLPCPQQTNEYDCGMHVIVNAISIIYQLELPSKIPFPVWRRLITVMLHIENPRLFSLATVKHPIISNDKRFEGNPLDGPSKFAAEVDQLKTMKEDMAHVATFINEAETQRSHCKFSCENLRPAFESRQEYFEFLKANINSFYVTPRSHSRAVALYEAIMDDLADEEAQVTEQTDLLENSLLWINRLRQERLELERVVETRERVLQSWTCRIISTLERLREERAAWVKVLPTVMLRRGAPSMLQ